MNEKTPTQQPRTETWVNSILNGILNGITIGSAPLGFFSVRRIFTHKPIPEPLLKVTAIASMAGGGAWWVMGYQGRWPPHRIPQSEDAAIRGIKTGCEPPERRTCRAQGRGEYTRAHEWDATERVLRPAGRKTAGRPCTRTRNSAIVFFYCYTRALYESGRRGPV